MRVALVSGYDAGVPGGVQIQVAGLARALAEGGVEVAVIAPRRRGDGGEDRGVAFFRAGRSYSFPVNGSVAPVAPTPSAAAATLRALGRVRPDLVHVHEPLIPGPPLAATLLCRTPVVATFHRADADALYRAEGRLLSRAVVARIGLATAVSPAATETARTVLGPTLGEVVEVPNGVEVARFEQAARRAGGTPEGRYKNGSVPLVAFVGRHEERKGARLLIQAVRRLEVPMRVVVAGAGPETDSLRRLAAGDGRVAFPGRISDDEVADLLASADVFVAPAIGGESFGVVLLEAMAAGTAVVAADLPGYVLAAAGAARVFEAGDADRLATALGDVLGDDAAREHLVVLGAARAAGCSMERVAGAYLECYRRLLGPGGVLGAGP